MQHAYGFHLKPDKSKLKLLSENLATTALNSLADSGRFLCNSTKKQNAARLLSWKARNMFLVKLICSGLIQVF